MLQTEQVVPLLHHTIPALSQVSFRLPIDVCSSPATPAAAAAAAGTALLTSVGKLLTRSHPSLDSAHPGQHEVSVVAAHSTGRTQSAQGSVGAQTAMKQQGVDEAVGAKQATPPGPAINR